MCYDVCVGDDTEAGIAPKLGRSNVMSLQEFIAMRNLREQSDVAKESKGTASAPTDGHRYDEKMNLGDRKALEERAKVKRALTGK